MSHPKPRIAHKISDAEEAAINRGIAMDPDARELTDAELAEMRPAREMLPMIFGEKAAGELMRRRSRPALAVTKVAVTVCYDQDAIDAFKATGDGWQTRMNTALREYAEGHGMFKNAKRP